MPCEPVMNSSPGQGAALLLLVLAQLPGIGIARTNAIIASFGTDSSMLDAGAESFMKVPGISERLACETAARLADRAWMNQARQRALEQIERAGRLQTALVTIADPAYPALLREIYDPPPLLFVRGAITALSSPSVSVVGTRKATTYGKQATELFCRELVENGYTIISGLAYGIDMTAHRAAVENDGTTIAVLGCGVDTIYTDPAGRLWPRIIERGAIVSEEWIGSEPAPGNFPKRNRLIAGMSRGTLVVESDVNGGSMITASCALEQNREVFAVPGSIFAKSSRGPNRLIRQSQAKAVLSAEDIFEELTPGYTPATKQHSMRSPAQGVLSPEEALVVGAIENEATHIDLIALKTGLPIETLLVHLFELELKRIVEQEPGRLFRKRITGN